MHGGWKAYAVSITAAVAVLLLYFRFRPVNTDPRVTFAAERERAGLHRKVGFALYEEVKLATVLNGLAGETQTYLDVDWNLLKQHGTYPDTIVRLFARDVTLDRALRTLWADRSLMAAHAPAGERILISSADEFAKARTLRLYDVRGIVGEARELRRTFYLTYPGFQGAADESDAERDAVVTEDISQIITYTVAADLWDTNGGTEAFVHTIGGTIAVVANRDVHRQVAELLDEIRVARGGGDPR